MVKTSWAYNIIVCHNLTYPKVTLMETRNGKAFLISGIRSDVIYSIRPERIYGLPDICNRPRYLLSGRIFGHLSTVYPTRYLVFDRISGNQPDICRDVCYPTGYLPKYLLSGRVFGQVSGIRYLAKNL